MAKADLLQAMREKANPVAAEVSPVPTKQANSRAGQADPTTKPRR